jgi:hypothetical protein
MPPSSTTQRASLGCIVESIFVCHDTTSPLALLWGDGHKETRAHLLLDDSTAAAKYTPLSLLSRTMAVSWLCFKRGAHHNIIEVNTMSMRWENAILEERSRQPAKNMVFRGSKYAETKRPHTLTYSPSDRGQKVLCGTKSDNDVHANK